MGERAYLTRNFSESLGSVESQHRQAGLQINAILEKLVAVVDLISGLELGECIRCD